MRYGIERGVGRHAESGRRERAGGGFTIEEAPPRVSDCAAAVCVRAAGVASASPPGTTLPGCVRCERSGRRPHDFVSFLFVLASGRRASGKVPFPFTLPLRGACASVCTGACDDATCVLFLLLLLTRSCDRISSNPHKQTQDGQGKDQRRSQGRVHQAPEEGAARERQGHHPRRDPPPCAPWWREAHQRRGVRGGAQDPEVVRRRCCA
ncbi:histone H4, putative [Bodo saltans]|uniref:Histone H4, putative n=1 Tax=Bodo saltans TaxID=75058 RepID=A0A0S4JPP3_BODSA|nr:histone H4, putative [Bodo saltans]|eukprot:CUG91249.1 histone H4, putative [Bodo saltans]